MNMLPVAPSLPAAKTARHDGASTPVRKDGETTAWQREMARARGDDTHKALDTDAQYLQVLQQPLATPQPASSLRAGWIFMQKVGYSGESEHAPDPRSVIVGAAARPVPVRVHVQDAGGQVAVWLGLDGDAQSIEARSAAIISKLHQTLASTGQTLATLVCNGRLVYEKRPPNHFY